MPDLPQVPCRQSRTQAQSSSPPPLGSGLGLGLGGGWFLVFSRWQPLPTWIMYTCTGLGFLLVLLGLLLLGLAVGNMVTRRRGHGY